MATETADDICTHLVIHPDASDEDRRTAIAEAVTAAIQQFLDRLDGNLATLSIQADRLLDLGGCDARRPADAEALRQSLTIAARRTWRLVHTAAARTNLETGLLGQLGDALLTYLTELDQQIVREHRLANGINDRDHLIDSLLSDSPVPAARASRVASAAAETDWPVPEEIVVMRVSYHGSFPKVRLGADILTRTRTNPALLICAAGAATHIANTLQHAAPGLRIAVSLAVSPSQGATGDRWARRALDLVDAGVIPPQPVIKCRDHATHLWLHSEPVLRRQLTQELLAPLLAESPNSRQILSETMLAWLESRDSAPAIASKLGVHPQTIRYRWKRINELFGTLLHDPQYVVSATMLLKATVPMWKAGDLSDVASYQASQC